MGERQYPWTSPQQRSIGTGIEYNSLQQAADGPALELSQNENVRGKQLSKYKLPQPFVEPYPEIPLLLLTPSSVKTEVRRG